MRAGTGWFCDKVIVVREATDTDTDSQLMTYFPCGQWLDRGQADGRIERTLLPRLPPEEPALKPQSPLEPEPAQEQESVQELEPTEEPPPELIKKEPKTKPSTFDNYIYY